MNQNNIFSILVVGSQKHPLAEKCLNWGEDFYIGDYDIVIFNLPSLTKEEFIKIYTKNNNYFLNIRDQIVEAQAKTDLAVFCIMDNFFDHLKENNYSWCSIVPIFEKNAGKKIPEQKKTLKIKYLNLIEDWEILLLNYRNNTGYKDGDGWEYKFEINEIPYLVNNLKRSIAFGLNWKVSTQGVIRFKSNKPIIFLPKIKDLSKGIDSIIDDFSSTEIPAPSWINNVKIHGEQEIQTEIENNDKQVEKLKQEKMDLTEKYDKITKFKKLLYLKGRPLEAIVVDGLRLLDVNLEELEVDNLEDRVFKYDNFSIPFEIRGKGSSGLDEKDLAQLIKRIADRERGEKYKTRGVFVINHFRNSEPAERKEVCNINIIKQAEVFNICIISTIKLFELVNKNLEGEKIDLKEKLFNVAGLFK